MGCDAGDPSRKARCSESIFTGAPFEIIPERYPSKPERRRELFKIAARFLRTRPKGECAQFLVGSLGIDLNLH